jgi:hypothetical protein
MERRIACWPSQRSGSYYHCSRCLHRRHGLGARCRRLRQGLALDRATTYRAQPPPSSLSEARPLRPLPAASPSSKARPLRALPAASRIDGSCGKFHGTGRWLLYLGQVRAKRYRVKITDCSDLLHTGPGGLGSIVHSGLFGLFIKVDRSSSG